MTSTQGAPTGTIRTAHASGLGAVVRELGDLHRAMLRAGGDETAVRLSVMTLIVACTSKEEMERAGEVVAAISREHPARAVLLLAEPEAEPGITAELRLECGVSGRSAGVCAELVQLRVGGEAALHLGSVVAPLLLPDVPVHVWIPGVPRLEQALSPDTLALCERVILDSAAFTDTAATLARLAQAIGAGPSTPVVDLAWLRLTTWRELIARALDAASRRPLIGGVDAVEVSGAPAPAALLAGWLCSRLGLGAGAVRLEPAPGAGAGLSRVRIHSRSPTEASVSVERDGDSLRTQVVIDGRQVAERAVPLDEPTLVDLVGAALQEGGLDPVYGGALVVAAGMCG